MTTALDRAKAVNYGPCDDNACCMNCEHFKIVEYAPFGTKCVCDELSAQVLKGYGCKLFKYRRVSE